MTIRTTVMIVMIAMIVMIVMISNKGGGADPRVPVPGTMSDKIARL